MSTIATTIDCRGRDEWKKERHKDAERENTEKEAGGIN